MEGRGDAAARNPFLRIFQERQKGLEHHSLQETQRRKGLENTNTEGSTQPRPPRGHPGPFPPPKILARPRPGRLTLGTIPNIQREKGENRESRLSRSGAVAAGAHPAPHTPSLFPFSPHSWEFPGEAFGKSITDREE